MKTFVIALKLAVFELLKRGSLHGGDPSTAADTMPLLLLDDIFDKLDAQRVEQIVKLVSGDGFGQIVITDTNRSHLDSILAACSHDYRIFLVEGGEVTTSGG
jgi:DNA replication and repair protein RecF